MVDFGKGRARPNGFGADVCPEYSRRQIVEEVRECIANGLTIVHVKFVDGNDMQDVTHEVVEEALRLKAADDATDAAIDAINDRIIAERDHARDLRKHEVA